MKTQITSAMRYSKDIFLGMMILGLTFIGQTSKLSAAPDEWLHQGNGETLTAWNFGYTYAHGLDDADLFAAPGLALSCLPQVNVSLGQGGFAVITALMLVNAPQYPAHQYVVDIVGPLTNTVYCEQLGQSLMVVVTELPTNNSCMSTIFIEDKLKPVFVCTSNVLPCTVDIPTIDFESYIESLTDNCDPDPDIWYSYTVQNLGCNPNNYTQQILVNWTATDASGNSSTCQDIIYLQKPSLGQIVFPPDITVSCVDANIDPSITGEPTYNGQPITHLCQYVVFKTDQVVPMCNGAQKIIRTWTVMDWCTSGQVSDVQIILIVDNTPPNITCPANITINTSPGVCTSSYVLPLPVVSDDCADPAQIDIDIFVSGVPGIFSPGQTVHLGLGTSLVTMRATDPCGNTRICQYSVTVKDLTPPIPACHPLVIGLGPDGMAILVANQIVFPIVENCGILSREVWRMSNNCNAPEDLLPGPDVKFCCADIGTTVMVAFKVTDLSGNMNTCMIEVTVEDQLPPIVVCQNVTISVTNQGSIVVTADQIEQSSSDNCQIISKTVTPTNFDCSDIGNHIVTLTVTDQSGNTATCTAIVTIVDEVPPVALCQNITVSVDDTGTAVIVTGQINNGSTDNCAIDTMFLDQYLFDCDDEGLNVVKLTVVDFSGNMDMCTATVTVLTAPPVAECQNITVSLDGNGEVTILASQVDDGSSDDCGIAMITVTPSEFDCDNLGPNVVTLTVTDVSDNTATCTAIVTVQDNMPPDAQCQNISIMLDDNGMATILAADINDGSTDNCEIVNMTVTPSSFDCEDVGPNIVTLTVTDQSGNSSTCTANVMVMMPDPPVALCQDITITLDPDGTVVIEGVELDNGSTTQCGMLTFEVTPNMFDCEDLGPNVVVVTVTDETGTSSSCTATVTVNEGPPVANCKDITVGLDANGEITIMGIQVDDVSTDDCGIETYSVTPTFFDCEDIGPNMVTLTVTDFSGLTSTCTATVTIVDNIPPVAVCQNITVTLDDDGIATIIAAQIDNGSTDNCGGGFTLMVTPSSFDCDDVGPNVVILTVTDESGNSSTCSATVTVMTGPPEAQCEDITVSLGVNGIVIIAPEQVDGGSGSNCGDLDLELDQTTFDCEDLGPHIVTLTVTDQNGNSTTCTATVTIIDDDAPICSANDLTIFVDAEGNASITADQIDDGSEDNCDIESISVTPTDFDCSDLGPNIVTLTVTDQSGNSSTCTATVTVMDTILPICAAMDITLSLDGDGVITITGSQVDDGSSDNCGPPGLMVNPSIFDCDDLGPNVVVLTVTDASGNSSSCSAIVTINDNGSLEAVCQNITIFLDANGNASIDPEDINNGSGGGCQTGDLEFDLSQTNFTCAHLGPNIVTLTVTDEDGAMATCTAVVTVVDLIPPMITCPANVTVDCHVLSDPENTGQFGNATASDNCTGTSVNETHIININHCGVGTIVRTFTATDISGNTASCTQLVSVINPNPLDEGDITWPVSPVNVNICNSTNPNAIPNGVPVIDAVALLCADPVVTFMDQVMTNVDNDPATPCMIITRTWTIVDDCQVNGTFVFVQTINVTDMVPPLFTNINDMTKVANANCVAPFTLIASATDCAGVSITNDSPYGATTGANASGDYPVGVTTVIFTATDGCGNISTMDVVITVTDPNPTGFQCEKVIVILPTETEILINAKLFVTFLPGSCSDADDFLISYTRNNPFDSLRLYDCGDVGVTTFSLYFFNITGNVLIDSCTTADLDLRDPDDHCQDGLLLWGFVLNEDGHALDGIDVSIMNAPMEPGSTDHTGQYQIEGLNEGEGYEVSPFHDLNHREGVSTLDLVMIQKHLLGKAKLNSPYKMIAADANKSGHLTALDLLEIRKLILGINTRFTHNTSWRFVDKLHVFPDPYNPFLPAFPESVWLDSVYGDIDPVNFVAIKIGDVNGSFFSTKAQGPEIKPRSGNVFEMILRHEAEVSKGRSDWKVLVPSGQGQIEGLQFSLFTGELSAEQVERIESDVLTPDQWYYQPDTRTINVSWSSGVEEDLTGKVILSVPDGGLRFREMELVGSFLKPEAYLLEEDQAVIREVNLSVEGSTAFVTEDYHLYQNIPNPFAESTTIRFSLPREEMVRLVVHDLAGRQLFIREARCNPGINEIVLHNRDLGTAGIYYYTLYTLNASLTRKMSFTNN